MNKSFSEKQVQVVKNRREKRTEKRHNKGRLGQQGEEKNVQIHYL